MFVVDVNVNLQVSDAIASSFGYKDLIVECTSLQYALYIPCFMCVLGGGFFLATALFLDVDRRKTEKAIKGYLKLPAIKTDSFFIIASLGINKMSVGCVKL